MLCSCITVLQGYFFKYDMTSQQFYYEIKKIIDGLFNEINFNIHVRSRGWKYDRIWRHQRPAMSLVARAPSEREREKDNLMTPSHCSLWRHHELTSIASALLLLKASSSEMYDSPLKLNRWWLPFLTPRLGSLSGTLLGEEEPNLPPPTLPLGLAMGSRKGNGSSVRSCSQVSISWRWYTSM